MSKDDLQTVRRRVEGIGRPLVPTEILVALEGLQQQEKGKAEVKVMDKQLLLTWVEVGGGMNEARHCFYTQFPNGAT